MTDRALADALQDRYALERELGRGGMATVYLARDLRHDRHVALKLLHPDLAVILGPERFLREIKLAARLQHPHILGVFDSGETGGQLWYTMPYVDGQSLRDRLRRERQLSLEEALSITRQAADALGYAHGEGVAHRDIKPENILLSRGHALVADFGVARALDAAGGDQLTATGMSVGTPAYMSPEQIMGDSTLDGRSDLYSLGCVLYEMLAGEAPFTGASSRAITAKHLMDPAPSARRLRPTVHIGVDAALQRVMAKAPADRFPTAEAFVRGLAAPASIEGESPPGLRESVRRAGSMTRGVGLTMALVLVGFAGVFLWRRVAPEQRSASVAPGPPRLVVLPFENRGRPEQEYFAEGMTDEVRGKLSALPALRVIARSSSTAYQNARKGPGQIGRELGVQYLVSGTVRWDRSSGGDRVRVSTELIETRDASTRWQRTFDAPMTDVFAVQAQIASQVAQALDLALGAKEQRSLSERPTQSLAAYDAFLRGEEASQAMGAADIPSIRRAIPFYQAAVNLDSTFAQAWARLAVAHAGLYLYAKPIPADAEAARRSLTRAEALAPDAPQTYAARQYYEGWVRLDWTRALAAAKVGLSRYPANSDLLLAAALAERSVRLRCCPREIYPCGGARPAVARRRASACRGASLPPPLG